MKLLACLFLCAAAALADPPLRLVIAGQTLMRYDIRTSAPDSAAAVAPLLGPADVVFTNLEAAIEGPGAEAPTRGPELLHAVDPGTLDAIRSLGFNLVALGDNHSWDLGTGGVVATLRAVEARGLAHAGTGRNLAEAAAPGFLDTPHGRVALIALASGKLGTGGAATADRPGVNELALDPKTGQPDAAEAARALASIRSAAARSALVIVYEHNHEWSDPLAPTPAWLEAWARACIDAGAGLFVEHGEPALQGVEIYRGRPIFYGLGSFIFQTRTRGQWNRPQEWQSVVAAVAFDGGRLATLRLHPISLNAEGVAGPRWLETRGWPRPAGPADARSIFERIEQRSAKYGTRWQTAPDGSLVAVLP